MNKGLIFDIRRFTVHDGPGIRTTVFFKGCPMSCWWCHNPESQLDRTEKYTRRIPLEGKQFTIDETVGKWMTVTEVMEQIRKDSIFYDESSGGVSFSGGEPLMQQEFLSGLVTACKTAGFQTTLDTCGYAEKDDLIRVMDRIDLFLFDIKLLDEADHIKYTGVSNKQVLENLQFLYEQEKNVILRFPYIPGITNSRKNLDALKILAERVSKRIHEIDLLPYHSLAKRKYLQLRKPVQQKDIPAVSTVELNSFKKELEEVGMRVKIGG